MDRRLFLLGLATTIGAGESLASQDGRPVLTLGAAESGQTNLSLADLDAMAQTELRTTTPWTEGVVSWSGPRMLDLLRAQGMGAAETVLAVAINDYAARIPMAELERLDPILATRLNGEILSRREKGPVFVMFDFDRLSATDHEIARNYAVWQLVRLEAV